MQEVWNFCRFPWSPSPALLGGTSEWKGVLLARGIVWCCEVELCTCFTQTPQLELVLSLQRPKVQDTKVSIGKHATSIVYTGPYTLFVYQREYYDPMLLGRKNTEGKDDKVSIYTWMRCNCMQYREYWNSSLPPPKRRLNMTTHFMAAPWRYYIPRASSQLWNCKHKCYIVDLYVVTCSHVPCRQVVLASSPDLPASFSTLTLHFACRMKPDGLGTRLRLY